MNYTIENKFLKVEVTDKGAELQSIVSKKTGREYLWQGNPEFWAGRAAVLFPICGRLTDGKYTWKGNTYEMTLHGFSRFSTHKVYQQKKDSITFELTADEESRKLYPFNFVFRMSYILKGNTIVNRFWVKNVDEEDLPFAVGGHPGFNVPFIEGEKFEDYYLEFATVAPARRNRSSDTCYYLNATDPYELRDGKFIDLRHDLFDNDAVFLSEMSKTVTLKSKTNDASVKVSYPKMAHVGFWHKPHSEAPYVCIEPWTSVPALNGIVDDFRSKLQMEHLGKGKIYQNRFDITITD